VFQHPTRPERENYSSLKKASGAVSASAGADETAGNYTVGMRNALQLAVKSGKITKDQAKKLESEGDTRISALKDAMSGSKGMSKEQQKDLLPQLDKLRGNIEDLIPGTERETAKAQLSGAGKFQKAIDSFLSTGRGGGRKKKPEEVSGTNQRMRLGKGTTKTKEGPVQRPVTSTGDIKPPKTGEPTDAASFLKRLSDAEDERKQAQRELETNSDGSKSYLQHQAQKRRNNPDLDARLTAADTAITTAQNNLTDFRARAQAAEKPKPEPTKPEPTKPEAPKPEPQRTEPVDTKPKRQPEEPAKPEVSSYVAPKPEKKKEKKPVETSNGQLPQELPQE
jgi:hypothetical protein